MRTTFNAFAAGALTARATAVCDWNQRPTQVIADGRIGMPPAVRVMAHVHRAVENAVLASLASNAS